MLNKLFHLRTCNRSLPRDTGLDRPCLNYHIRQCDAPCQGYISKEDYREHVEQALEFLNGNYRPVIQMLEEEMREASDQLDFEKAIEKRDLLTSVKQVAQKQKITASDGEDKDVIAVSTDQKEAVVQIFFVRDGRLIGREHFYLQVAPHDSRSTIINSFLKQFYSGTPFIPREIMLQEEIEDQEILEQWLSARRNAKVHIRVPRKGTKEKLVELAEKNARMVLIQDSEKIRREESRTIGALKEIGNWLGLEHLMRVEAFDISNISGFESVGSMIVYEKGKPKQSDYRKFKIKTVKGPDDYASMEEVLRRRFEHGMVERQEGKEDYGKFSRFPDLIMMDGGKGQVNVALRVLDELHITIPVCGMVKDDHHRTRGLYYNNEEIPIDTRSEGFHLITRIQDEAHRFAIEYHRSLRGKQQVHSVLDDIEGIGETRRKALMRRFKSLEAVRDATLEELEQTDSMNRVAAQKVYDFFH